MFKAFKKYFQVPYDEGLGYPTKLKAMNAVSDYCDKNDWNYSFVGETEVEIDGVLFEVRYGAGRGFCRAGYGVECVEK